MKASELADELIKMGVRSVPFKYRETLAGLVECGGDDWKLTLVVIRTAVELLNAKSLVGIDESNLLAALVFPDRLEELIQTRGWAVTLTGALPLAAFRLAIFLYIQDRKPGFNVHRSSDF
ncbi:MAG: hypothetical protein AAB478_03800 [Patescibacteria group bacterium]